MVKLLDSRKFIIGLDRSRMRDSISQLPMQFRQVWRDLKKLRLPGSYGQVTKVMVSGMGGSGLGGRLADSLFSDRLTIPLQHIHDYQIPQSVDSKTLFYVSSYSGNTEEPIATYHRARKRGAKLFVFAAAGKLAALARKDKVPAYFFEEKHNPCSQPRMGLGYSLTPIIRLLTRLGFLRFSEREFEQTVRVLEKQRKRWGVEVPQNRNAAKKLSASLVGKLVAIIASEFLSGNAQIFSNQINENGKNFATNFIIPELNHHLLEGLVNPRSKNRDLVFLFIESGLYQKENSRRHEITKEVAERLGIKCLRHRLVSRTRIEQSFELLMLGSYVSFYLAMLNRVDPSPIPWVDYFKKQLSRRKF